MIKRATCCMVLVLAGCAQSNPPVKNEWGACLVKGQQPHPYVKEFSRPKAQGVFCANPD